MCGIIGGAHRHTRLAHERISNALSSLRHRGPDAEGIYEHDNLFLGHRRLSIIDLDLRANQPMRVGPLVISFNGEIYNYRQVRADLQKLGFSFTTESDTEVIAVAFQHEGLRCLERFEGMFAFAIWNETTRVLSLARDRFGEKPLLYYYDNERFYFASEMQALECLIGRNNLTVDDDAIRLYFQFTYIPAPRTPYRNMQQLLPGSWLELDTKNWNLGTGTYYALKPQPSSISKKKAIAELRTRLTDSVKLRLAAADVPVATFLSGGIDSSIITALAAQYSPGGVRAYSIGFPEDHGFDEAPYARMVAARYPQIRHTVIDTTENTLLDFIEKTISRLAEPYADASIIPTAFLCSKVEEKVILGGDGADEIFAGYGVYAAMRASQRIPSPLKSLLRAIPAPGNPAAIRNPKLRALALFRSHLGTTELDEYLSWRSYCSAADLKALSLKGNDIANVLLGNPNLSSLSDLLAFDIQWNLPNDMLKKVDLASMQHSIELRAPFLDRGLVEFALSLPEDFLIHGKERKHILRETFRDLVPEPILTRRKQGFLMPIRRWFKDGTLRQQLIDMLDNRCPLDKVAVNRFLSEHRAGTHDHSALLWSCYVFLKWSYRSTSTP